jgi:Xaa-Pro aminopeptidase
MSSTTNVTNGCEVQRGRLRGILEGEKLRAAVLSSYQAVSYLAGTNILTQMMLPDRPAFYLYFADGRNTLLVCDIETGMVLTQTDITDVQEYVEFAQDPWEVLGGLLTERGVGTERIGFEARRMPAEGYEKIRRVLPDVKLVAIDDAVEDLQSVKSADEVEKLRYAAQVTLDAVLSAVDGGSAEMGELGLAADMTAKIVLSAGAPRFTFLASGERALGAHMDPADRVLEPGHIWRVDLGARFFDRINSDLARTGVVGDPTGEQEELLQGLLAAQAAGFNAVEPGRPASGVFHAVREEFNRQFEPRGVRFQMPHVGHGLGTGLHEAPILHPGNDVPLEPGMVLAIEPMLKATDRGECYHTEDLVVVTESGHELLTQPQRELLRVKV